MAIAVGVAKKLVFKRQSALGTPATGSDVTAKYLRRVTSTIDLAKQAYKSAEILPSMQRRDFRHGVRSVAGTIHGEVSVGTYQAFMESVLRQPVQTAATTGAVATLSANSGTPGNFTTTAAQNFITLGFKIGDVINATGFLVATTNNNANYLVTNVTATVLTVIPIGATPAVVSRVIGDTVTIAAVGKKTWIPQSAQTRDYYTIEHAFTDITQSEYFTDCVITGMKLNLPATGMATADFNVMGLYMTPGTTPFFTAPAAASTGGILAAVNGILLIGGVQVGLVTGLSIDVNGNYSAPGGVVGANTDPDIFPGSVDVTGQATVYFQDAVMKNYFINETEVEMIAVLSATQAVNSPFTSIVMPRVKFAGATKDDGEKGLMLTMPFTALELTGGSAVDLATTISIQDSAFV
jgi:hypothetical protein